MKKLNIIQILEHYDVPQLFVAVDAIGMHYLCLLYDMEDNGDLDYLAVSISFERLNNFIKGHIDLRSLFVTPEIEDALYDVRILKDGIYAKSYDKDLDNEMLPDDGYFYDDSFTEDEEMLARSATKHCPIIRLAFQTDENRHDMSCRCLSAALVHFQSLVDNSFRALHKNVDHAMSNLRVTTFMAASFDIEFIADENLDLFGQSKIGDTFEFISKLFGESSEDVVNTLRYLKGYAANSYKKFLDVLIDNELSVDLKWVFSTLDGQVHSRSIRKERILALHNIINNHSELELEEQFFNGCFIAANTTNGKWSFQPKVGKEIKGDSIDVALLSGVTLLNCQYKIVCQAQQTLNDTTLKEKTKYTLTSVSIEN